MVSDDPESFADLDGHDPTAGSGVSRAACDQQGLNCKDTATATQQQTNSAAQFAKDETIGIAKELANTVIGLTNLVDNGINAALSLVGVNSNLQTPEFNPSTPGEKSAMLGTSIALLLAPGGGEVKAGETLSRLGTSSESAARLARKAAEAEEKIGIHGASATAREVTGTVSRAAMSAVESVFKVHDTPTKSDPLHRTIELAKPVTRAIADAFNNVFGRTP